MGLLYGPPFGVSTLGFFVRGDLMLTRCFTSCRVLF